jgi:hypothetical protein
MIREFVRNFVGKLIWKNYKTVGHNTLRYVGKKLMEICHTLWKNFPVTALKLRCFYRNVKQACVLCTFCRTSDVTVCMLTE